ncbi:MAG: ribonuclease HI [Sphaerochaetaceae bacterium]|jgi:ribonuclease HI|nr:ribonuclease HI [Sphaerochaetaceae bacterium]
MQKRDVVVFTDGGCSGNPGPGGWAFVINDGENGLVEQSGGESQTTNNRMELQAVIKALEYISINLKPVTTIQIHTDSQYVKNGITLWIHTWKKNGWRTAAKAPVKNKEYWMALDSLASKLPITWHWVKGHAGIELNERCDTLVRQEMDLLLNNR